MTDKTGSSVWAAIGPLLGALIGAGAALGSQAMQGSRESSAQCQVAVAKQEEVLRQKAEVFLVAVSEQISFFRQNNRFEVRAAREKLAEVQKAAFALSAYAEPDLSLKSLAAVVAIDASLLPNDVSELQAGVDRLTKVMSEWHPSFRAELHSLREKYASCKNTT